LKEFRPDAPVELEQLLRQVLDKDPEKRPQTAAEFAKKLGDLTTATIASASTEIPHPEKQEKLSQADKPTTARETDAFTPQAGTTFRAGAPTLEHPSSAPQPDNAPSVQGYVGSAEATTEVATKIAAPLTEQNRMVEEAQAIEVEAIPTDTGEPQRAHAQDSGDPASKRNVLIYAIAIFLLGFVAVAIWFALTRSSRQTVGQVSPSETSPAKGSAPGLPAPRRAENPATVDTSNSVDHNGSQKNSPTKERAELSAALNDWVAATNSRDINKQMVFYAPTLDVFYLKRNATIASVRAEKAGLLAQVDSVEVRAGEPEIQLAPDGRAATMRFHKSWNFNGRRPESGEVIQELRWRKTDSGWKIVSERDVEIIRLAK
jgi:ketosteroid isomerase-like protein